MYSSSIVTTTLLVFSLIAREIIFASFLKHECKKLSSQNHHKINIFNASAIINYYYTMDANTIVSALANIS